MSGGEKQTDAKEDGEMRRVSLPDHVPVGVLVSSGLHRRDNTVLEPGLALGAVMERTEEIEVLLVVPSRHREDLEIALLEVDDRWLVIGRVG